MKLIGLILAALLAGLTVAEAQQCRYFATPPTMSPGATGNIQCDADGNLRVTGSITAVAAPSSASTAAVTNAQSTAAASNLVVKATPGNLYQVTATIGATSGYLMLFDSATLPGNGAVTPIWCGPVTSNGTNGSAALQFDPPKPFATGITAGFSTTGCFTLTASTTAAFFAGYK